MALHLAFFWGLNYYYYYIGYQLPGLVGPTVTVKLINCYKIKKIFKNVFPSNKNKKTVNSTK